MTDEIEIDIETADADIENNALLDDSGDVLEDDVGDILTV